MSRALVKLFAKRSINGGLITARTVDLLNKLTPASFLVKMECYQSTDSTADPLREPSSKISKYIYRCSINDPLRHETHHEGKFYQIDSGDLKVIDPDQEQLRKEHYAEWKAFDESCLMIRKPALEIMGYLRNLDLSQPVYKFILYGLQEGTGKRSVLFHLIHYCYKNNWLLVNLPNCSSVLRFAKDKQPSSYKEGRWDTPIEAMDFIKRFSKQNMHLLKNLNLTTSKNYVWNSRESTPEGTSLFELFKMAEEKPKLSSDICAIIVREIKLQSKSKNLKVLVTMDQLNSYLGPTRLTKIDRTPIPVDDVTIAHGFKKLLLSDWTNAIVVGIVNGAGKIIPAPNKRTKFYDTTIPWSQRRRVECKLHYEGPLTPMHLLKQEGFFFLEPFIPIEVPGYSLQEASNHFEYYKERNWLQAPKVRTDEGKEEIFFLSGRNPAQFMRVCKTL